MVYEDLDEVNMFFVGQSLSLDGRISMFAVVSFFCFVTFRLLLVNESLFLQVNFPISVDMFNLSIWHVSIYISPMLFFFQRPLGAWWYEELHPVKTMEFLPKKNQPDIDAGQELFAILNINYLIFWVPNFDPYPHSKWHSVGSSFRPGSAALVTYCFRGPAWYGFSTVI